MTRTETRRPSPIRTEERSPTPMTCWAGGYVNSFSHICTGKSRAKLPNPGVDHVYKIIENLHDVNDPTIVYRFGLLGMGPDGLHTSDAWEYISNNQGTKGKIGRRFSIGLQ